MVKFATNANGAIWWSNLKLVLADYVAHCCAIFLGHLGIDIEIQISISERSTTDYAQIWFKPDGWEHSPTRLGDDHLGAELQVFENVEVFKYLNIYVYKRFLVELQKYLNTQIFKYNHFRAELKLRKYV